jgi:nucleoside-diphosphate-sugar epimerase
MRPASPRALLASPGETYNVGTERERSVLEVAKDIARIFNMPESKVRRPCEQGAQISSRKREMALPWPRVPGSRTRA